MASTVAIMNMAAVLIGTESRVTDPADDRFLATTLREVWDTERQATLRDGAWNFATKRRELMAAELAAGETIYPWAYAYELPSDCLKLIEVLDDSARDRRELEGGRILCNAAAPLRIRYVFDVPEPALWDALFASAFAARLAFICGDRIAGSVYDSQKGERIYWDRVRKARSSDSLENPRIENEESDWILARNSGAVDDFGYWHGDYPG